MTPIDIFFAIMVALGWGLGFVFIKSGLAYFPPIFFIAIRFILSGLLLLPFYWRPMVSFKKLILIAIFNSIYHIGVFKGGAMGVDIATIVITVQFSVPFTSILSVFFLGDKLGWQRLMGLMLAFGGLIIIVGTPNVLNNLEGFYYVLSAAIASAAMNISIKKINTTRTMGVLCWSTIISIIPILLLAYFMESPAISVMAAKKIPLSAIYSLLFMAIVSTIFSFGFWYALMHKYSVNQVAPFSLLTPFFGIMASMLVFGEKLSDRMIIGGVLTIIGVATVVFRRPDFVKRGAEV